jgi:HAE1 family hydrophobic/amphiphilic exporter-1
MEGQVIPLAQVADIRTALSPGSIERLNRRPAMSIKIGVSGRGSSDVTNDIEQALNTLVDFPAGYGFQFTGRSDIERDAFSELLAALTLSILLMYMLLVSLYQSWLQPLAIMFTLPVALVGAFGGLWLTGTTFNITSLLGIIMLVGLVTKNAVLLIDFTNQLRVEEGYSIKEALAEAGRLRLRPILMTVLTLVLALIPLMFGRGAGAEMRHPIAAVIVGGMTTSTLLTFFLVPVVYNFFEWGSPRVIRALRKGLGLGKQSPADTGQQDPTPVRQPSL